MATISIPSPSAFLSSPTPSVPRPITKSASGRTSKTTRASSSTVLKGDGVAKPKQSKSRNGCVTCKAKRLKCDEIKPSCQQCHKRGVTCGGYKKDFKWRPFEEATFTSKPTPQRTRKASVSAPPPKPAKYAASSPALSDASNSTVNNDGSSLQTTFQSTSPTQMKSTLQLTSTEPPPFSHDMYAPELSQYSSQSNNGYIHPPYNDQFQPSSAASTTNTMYDDGSTMQSLGTAASSFSSGQSPRLIDLLLPGTDLNARSPDFMEYPPLQSDVPYQPGGYQLPEDMMDQDDDVEEIVRQPNLNPEAWIMRLPSPSPSNSSSSSDGSRYDPLNAIYRPPDFHANSPEMLMVRFDRQTCGILSVKDGPTENPWRTLVWPLARDSPALYHAISSMTAFHTSKEKPEMRVEGMEHMRRSIRSLAAGIESMRTDTALATTLVLAFSESWDRHISTGIEHLRGAKALVNQALVRHQQSTLIGDDLTRLKFLCNTWVYMDVIARLTSVDDDDSNDFDAVLWYPLGLITPNNEVDPLMGCATTLFPLIGRVANLVRRVRKNHCNSVAIISQAMELKTAVEDWVPPDFFEPPEDPTSEITHSLQTAEAYRWATLLYLHQAVPEIPSISAVQLAKKVLVFLATVPLSSRAIIVQIYPLLAAGCEASGQEDRAWVEDRWAAMAQRMLIGNIDRCWEVIKEVWDRRDSYDAEKRQREQRRFASRVSSGYASSMESVKRKLSTEEQDIVGSLEWSDPFGSDRKRRATNGEMGMPAPIGVHQQRRHSTGLTENFDLEKSVRGRLHWVGVMKDWHWEVLLG
ncbi:MAG: hypothetical protein M1830_009445 [Pleopsidium flavum]|nr:MAG: hypothetical protein M1830_009445 [Pleopsidium flavum]